MAVMTSISPDSVAHEQRQPVPSDKMALDLDINGTSNHDESNRDLALPDSSINSISELPSKPSAEVANGIHNADAFDANNTIIDPLDALFEGKQREVKGSDDLFIGEDQTGVALNSLTTQQTSTQDSSLDLSSTVNLSNEPQLDAIEVLPPSTSSVPPVIEAQQSDLREEISPATRTQADEVKAEKHDLDLTADPSLAAASGDSSFDNDMMDSESAIHVEIAPAITASTLSQEPLHPQSVADIDLNHTSQQELPTLAETTTAGANDISMMDAPRSPTKAARAREEDSEQEPSAKRTKTEDESSVIEFAVPAPVSAVADKTGPEPGDELAPTQYQMKEMLKAVRVQKGTNNGKNFRDAAAKLWPNFADAYSEKIKNPIDLLLIETRLKDNAYSTIGEFKNDVNLVYANCVTFNGVDHAVTKSAEIVRSNILSKIPGPEPVKVEKKARIPLAGSPPPRRRQAPSQGPSVTISQGAAPAASPTEATPAQTFALNPSGTPLIRRDSTKDDAGRPKRKIQPPKNKDLIYNPRPKKKYAKELKFCIETLNELKKPKYGEFNQPFLTPVDPVALGIPDYFKIIKHPMDLSTVSTKLANGEITTAKEFESDVRQIFKNCFKFNPEGSAVNEMGKSLERLFEAEWEKKSQWIADHPSPENPGSPTATESDADESEEEDEPPASDSTALLQARLIEEQNKLIGMLATKKPDPALEQLQRDFIKIIQTQVDQNNKAQATKSKPKTKATKKSATASKKKVEPVKKAYKAKNIGMTEKEQISEGISRLEGRDLDAAIAILKKDMPSLVLDGEEELDIDMFSNRTLSELHDLVIKKVPGIIPVKQEPVRQSKPSRPKKNKPMSKHEQEAKIAKLKDLTSQYEAVHSGASSPANSTGGVMPTVEQDQSSGDESPSDSEED